MGNLLLYCMQRKYEPPIPYDEQEDDDMIDFIEKYSNRYSNKINNSKFMMK